MSDDRLVTGLSAWLKDSDVPPPDPLMSASRVMAGIEVTPQLGRFWPPKRLAGAAKPAPALGAFGPEGPPSRPVRRAHEPRFKKAREVVTPVRALTVIVVLALVGGSGFLALSFLPQGESAAMAVPTMSAAPLPASAATPQPTPIPTPERVMSTAESAFVASRVLTELEPGADPVSLDSGALRTAVFVDRAAGKVYEIARDGYPRLVAVRDDAAAGGETLGAPVLAVRGGEDIVIFDAEGLGWRWVELSSPGYLDSASDTPGDPDGERRQALIDPTTQAITATTEGRREYDVYLADPSSGDIVRYSMRLIPGSEDFELAPERTERDGRAAALDLHVDPQQYVLTDAGVERWVDGQLDDGFALAAPPGDPPEYRYIDGIGSDGDGRLWLFDAGGHRMVAFDKADGTYLGSWAPGPDAPPLDDVRGIYVEGDGTGAVGSVTWLTPEGVMQGAVSDPAAIAPDPGVQTGDLTPSDREDAERDLDWSDEGMRMEADRLSLKVGGRTFSMPGEVLAEADIGAREAELALHWYERGIEQRLLFHAVTDGSHWWLSDIWTYDGVKGDGEWIFFDDLASLTRTPLGEPVEGDLAIASTGAERKQHQKDGSGKLRIDGLRLTAFAPGTRRGPLVACEPVEHPDLAPGHYPAGLLQGPGEPLEGIAEMTPRQAEARLQELGLCYLVDHRWKPARRFDSDRLQALVGKWEGEQRCSAPEAGTVEGVAFRPDDLHMSGDMIVHLEVVERTVRDAPDLPPAGTDCPTR